MPSWLPEIVPVDGEWKQVLAALYAIFDSDFKQTKRCFQHRPVWWNRRVLPGDMYEEGFWHLIMKQDENTNARLFDPRRAERLPWCGPTISNSHDGEVMVWDCIEGSGRLRTYIWLQYWDYVVILEKRQQRVGEVAFLITAFYVDGDSKRRDLQRKYEKRIA